MGRYKDRVNVIVCRSKRYCLFCMMYCVKIKVISEIKNIISL